MNREVRIFISSPGDVVEEREKARQVISTLQRHFPETHLRAILWEDLALPATASFQETIDHLIQNQPIDIAVFILWSRLGSPLGSQICRPDGGRYRSGTEREFETMLAAYESSGRLRPLILAYAREDEAGFRRLLGGCPGRDLEEMVEQRKLVEAFLQERFKDAEGHNSRAYCIYSDPIVFAHRLHTHLRQSLDQMLAVDGAPRWQHDPYRGLESFDLSHAEIFHGREEEVCDLLQRLRSQGDKGSAFAVIVGASGSGKSSLARAGVAATLVNHSFEDGVKRWRGAVLTPSLCEGAELCRGLVDALAKAAPELFAAGASLEAVAAGLEKDPALTVELTFKPAFLRAGEVLNGDLKTILVLDQLEELWTDEGRFDDQVRERFLLAVEALTRCGHVAALATLRSDFYPHAQRSPTFLRLKGASGHFDLLPPGPAAMQRLIMEPARMAGVRFERDERTGYTLDQKLLEDALRDPAALPLLQYALSELYARRDAGARLLTFAAYRALGGVEGAIGRRAGDTVGSLPIDARAALQEILPRLVTIDVAGEQAAVRRRAILDDLTATPAQQALVEALVQARFLTTDLQGEVRMASLAHEALLRKWDELAAWVSSNREHLRIRARLEQSQKRWEDQQFDPSLLLPPGLQLEEGKQILSEAPELVLPEMASYIRKSIDVDEAEKHRRRRRRRLLIATLAALTTLATAASITGFFQQRLANQRTSEALEAQRKLTNQLYDNSVALAEREIGQNQDLQRAVRLLEGKCPDELRGWEWRYLKQQVDGVATRLGGRDGHKFGLWGAEFSHDGRTVATCSIDGTLKFWDAESGVCRRTIDADYISGISEALRLAGQPRLPVMCLAYSPDGRYIATGSFRPSPELSGLSVKLDRNSPGLVRIWDATSGKKVSEFNNFLGVVLGIAFSPDGRHLAVSAINKDFSFGLWDLGSGRQLARGLGAASHVHCLRFTSDGQFLLTSETAGYVRKWNASTLVLLDSFEAHEAAPIVNMSLAPNDSNELATGAQDGLVRVWNLEDKSVRLEMKGHQGAVLDVQYSPDGRRIATAGADKTVRLWDSRTGEEKITLRGHSELVWHARFSRDGDRLVSASFDRTARIWDARTDRIDGSTRSRVFKGHTDRVNSVASSSSGQLLASGGWDRTVRVWDPKVEHPLTTLEGHSGAVFGVAMSADGNRIASASWDRTAAAWDRGNGRRLTTFRKHIAPVQAVAITADGSRVASAGFDGQVYIWNAIDGGNVVHCEGFVFPAYGVAFDPTGTRLACGCSDRSVKIWDAVAGKLLKTLKGHAASIPSVAFSPDGRLLASAGWDHDVFIWQMDRSGPDPKPQKVLRGGHTDRVNGVAFSPDGRLIATASEDKTVRLWDVDRGIEIAAPRRHRAFVWGVAFVEQGKSLASGSWMEGAEVQVWPIEPTLLESVPAIREAKR